MRPTFKLGPADDWYWGEDAFAPVWFAVRVLLDDGLRVEPFFRHATGNGRLRELGLNEQGWRNWLITIVSSHNVLADFARSPLTETVTRPADEDARAAARLLQEPGTLYDGPDALKLRLNQLYAELAADADSWKSQMLDWQATRSGSRLQTLWESPVRFPELVQPFTVYLVEYTEPAVMASAPNTCLISPDVTPDGYRRQLHEAAAAFSDSAGD